MISFYDTRKFSLIKTKEFKNNISEFEFDRTNSVLLVTSYSGCLYVIDAQTFDKEPLAVIDAHFPAVNTINIDRSNKLFATGAADALICIWDLEEMICKKVIKNEEYPIRKVNFSYDARLIAAIYEGNNLDIFNVEIGDCVYSIPTESAQYSIAWNPNSYSLAYCGDDKSRSNLDGGNIHLLSINN